MGFIEMGKQSRGLLGTFLGHDTRVLAVCDVDTTRRDNARKKVDEFYAGRVIQNCGCAAWSDFREVIAPKDIDAVCIAIADGSFAVAAGAQSGGLKLKWSSSFSTPPKTIAPIRPLPTGNASCQAFAGC